jgi:hypothetical protein
MSDLFNHAAAAVLLAAITCAGSQCGAAYSREDFDKADSALNNGSGYKTGLGDYLAWGESYIMMSYVEMYRATKDTHYLDKLADHADCVLASRDDSRGFRDYSGRSRAAWSVGGKFTVAELTLKDTDGKAVVKLRSTRYAYNDETKVRVVPRPADGEFDLFVENARWKQSEEYKGLTMDRQSTDFAERRVNARDWAAKERKIASSDKGSGLVTVEALRASLPAESSSALEPLWMAYHGYSGMIMLPMLEFARIVKADTSLVARYGKAADRYVAEALKVFRDANEEWRDGPRKHEGYYVFGSYGCPFWSDNVAKPFNYLGSEGICLIRLGQLTGDRHWTARASAIARLFKRHLKLAENGAYVWEYWWGPIADGWTRDNSPSFNTPTYGPSRCIEDTSHGCLEIYFAMHCAEAGIVFDDEDMRRFAKTFLLNIVDLKKLAMNDRVDGSGEVGHNDSMVGYWMELGKWNSRAASVAVKIADRMKLSEVASGSSMLTLARAIKWGCSTTTSRQPAPRRGL